MNTARQRALTWLLKTGVLEGAGRGPLGESMLYRIRYDLAAVPNMDTAAFRALVNALDLGPVPDAGRQNERSVDRG